VIARALLFDFNGTLSDDEAILCEIWREIFAARGKPLSPERYFAELAGLSDPEIAERWLGPEHVEEAMREHGKQYRDAVADGSTIGSHVREAVRYAAERVLVGVVSGAARADVELVLGAARLSHAISALVAAEEVERGKPDPGGYLLALERLEVAASDAVALEDSEAGVAAVKAAGIRCVAVLGTLPRDRLARADEIVERVDLALIRRILD
jgi:beta-phosphoglucomutase